MHDEYRETTHQSWFSRLYSSVIGVFVGLLMLLGGIFLLFWNEGRAVQMAQSLKEGQKTVINVDSKFVEPKNEGKLIYTIGQMSTSEQIVDELTNLRLENVIVLQRTVEMYQWEEKQEKVTNKNLGGSETTETTYKYTKVWSESEYKSENFKVQQGHQNPSKPFESRRFQAQTVTLGDFQLNDEMKNRLSDLEAYSLDTTFLSQLPENIRNRAEVLDNFLYIGQANKPINSTDFKVGDIRIKYSLLKPTTLSVIAMQKGKFFEAYTTHNGNKLLLMEKGSKPAEEMFKSAVQGNNVFTWVLRLVGYLLVSFGIGLFFKPFTTFADFIPFLGNMLGMGTGLFSAVIGFIISLVTASVAWFYYRPILSIGLIVAGVGIFIVVQYFRKKK